MSRTGLILIALVSIGSLLLVEHVPVKTRRPMHAEKLAAAELARQKVHAAKLLEMKGELISKKHVTKQAAFLVLSLRARLLAIPAQHAGELLMRAPGILSRTLGSAKGRKSTPYVSGRRIDWHFGIYIKTFNRKLEGRSIQTIKYTDTEPFPKLR